MRDRAADPSSSAAARARLTSRSSEHHQAVVLAAQNISRLPLDSVAGEGHTRNMSKKNPDSTITIEINWYEKSPKAEPEYLGEPDRIYLLDEDGRRSVNLTGMSFREEAVIDEKWTRAHVTPTLVNYSREVTLEPGALLFSPEYSEG